MTYAAPLRSRRNTVSPAFVARLERALMIAARAVEYNPAALPIFERIDAEYTAAKAEIEIRTIECPIERARVLARSRAT